MASGNLTVRDAVKTAADLEKLIDDFAVLYLQAVANFGNVDEGSGTGPPRSIGDVVGIDPTDEATYGVPNAAMGWVYGGDSRGTNFNPGRETRWIDTDQHPRAVEKHQLWTPTFTGVLAQLESDPGTLNLILAILGGGSMEDVPAVTPLQKRVKFPMGSEIQYRRAALLIPHRSPTSGEERTVLLIIRKGSVKATGDVSFAGQTPGGIPFSIEASYDDRPTVPTDEQLMYAYYAPGS